MDDSIVSRRVVIGDAVSPNPWDWHESVWVDIPSENAGRRMGSLVATQAGYGLRVDYRAVTITSVYYDASVSGWGVTFDLYDPRSQQSGAGWDDVETFVVNWGDGTDVVATDNSGPDYGHVYASPGTYDVRLQINFPDSTGPNNMNTNAYVYDTYTVTVT